MNQVSVFSKLDLALLINIKFNIMKKHLLLYVSSLFLLSCSDNDLITYSSDKDSVLESTKGIVYPGDISITNPNLISDWENLIEVTSNKISGEKYTLPWVAGATTYLSDEFRTNIKKEDGWIMLIHTFKGGDLDTRSNYMLFYNKLQGILKLFYYFDGDVTPNNGYMWHIALGNQNQSSRLFDMTEFFTPSQTEKVDFKNAYISNGSVSAVDGMFVGWNGTELEISYNQLEDLNITIGGFNRQIASVELSGSYESTSEGIITVASSSQNFGKLAGAIALVAGDPALKLIQKIGNSSKIKLGARIKNAIAKLNEGDVASALKAGLNFIFGKSTVLNQYGLKFSTQGTITLGGTVQSSLISGIAPIAGINLKKIITNTVSKTAKDSNPNSQIVYSQNSFDLSNLGVWNLEKAPELNLSKYSRLMDGYTQSIYKPEQVLPLNYKVVFNPDISKFIKKYTVSHELVLMDLIGKQPYEPINPPTTIRPSGYFPQEIEYSDSCLSIMNGNLKPRSQKYLFTPVENGNYDYFYEWPDILDNYAAVITVEIEYEYLNKNNKILTSRYYRVDVKNNTDYDSQILTSGRYRNPYIIRHINF